MLLNAYSSLLPCLFIFSTEGQMSLFGEGRHLLVATGTKEQFSFHWQKGRVKGLWDNLTPEILIGKMTLKIFS